MSKDYIILTNNRIIADEYIDDSDFDLVFEEGLPGVLEECMKMLGEGCTLAVDPLAGYLSRPNPFHTIVLQRGSSDCCGNQLSEEEIKDRYLKDVTKVDSLLSRYWGNKEAYDFHSSCQEYRDDHSFVDASIGRNSISIIKNSL